MKSTNRLVGFVTPTSFLGVKYFTKSRNLLSEIAQPLSIDFISVRSGVFDQVLQETCLVPFGHNVTRCVTTSKINIENNTYSVERIGNVIVKGGNTPWIIVKEPEEANIVTMVKNHKT